MRLLLHTLWRYQISCSDSESPEQHDLPSDQQLIPNHLRPLEAAIATERLIPNSKSDLSPSLFVTTLATVPLPYAI